jgi:hypothetical protein
MTFDEVLNAFDWVDVLADEPRYVLPKKEMEPMYKHGVSKETIVRLYKTGNMAVVVAGDTSEIPINYARFASADKLTDYIIALTTLVGK